MAPYQYSPLAGDEIRLLTLSSRLSSRPVISLDTIVLTEELQSSYEALSYAWGSSKKSKHVAVEPLAQVLSASETHPTNSQQITKTPSLLPQSSIRFKSSMGRLSQRYTPRNPEQTISITLGLVVALRYLRLEDKPRKLWIDAICINQCDLKERSQQVKLMADIYKKSARVVIWLGSGNAEALSGMRLLERLSSRIEVDFMAATIKPAKNEHPRWADNMSALMDREWGSWYPISSLLSYSWFRRLWIWQEVRANPDRAILMCGKSVMQWNSFRKAVVCIASNVTSRRITRQNCFILALRICRHLRLQSLVELIYETRRCECSEERDRIYALLGMLDNPESNSIEPDYTKQITDVYKDVVLQDLKITDRLDVLRYCMMRNKSDEQPIFPPSWMRSNNSEPTEIPTWVPDWIGVRRYVRLPPAHASLSTSPAVEHNTAVSLDVMGIESATVESIHTSKTPLDMDDLDWVSFVDTILQMIPHNAVKEPYIMGGTLFDAYLRTLCADNFADRNQRQKSNASAADCIRRSLLEWKCYLTNTERDKQGNLRRRISTEWPEILACDLEYQRSVETLNLERAVLITREGHVCLGPRESRKGDRVCVVLGCDVPLVLRPTADEKYLVVGGCYVHGLMNGEALLGRLPSDFQPVLRTNPNGCSYHAYVDRRTGQIQIDDPRISEPLLRGWRTGEHGADRYRHLYVNDDLNVQTWEHPRLKIDVLRERGVKLRNFSLV